MEDTDSRRWLLGVVGAGVVTAVLIILFVANRGRFRTISTSPVKPLTEVSGDVVKYVVQGSNYRFEPNKITVKKGGQMMILFKNAGGSHDLVIDGFGVKTRILDAGQQETVSFTADRVGKFSYYCSNHRRMGMEGTLVVTE